MSTATPKPARKAPARRSRANPYVAPQERAAQGRARRAETPRASHADWEPASDRPDPVALLEAQAADRVPELVPIRYARMSASPFAFYRGAACVMAADLADTPRSGITAQLCGDAHLANFGGFASPERRLLFDLNDFDETLPGPWEWDLKRLAASVCVVTGQNGVKAARRSKIVRALVCEYRQAMSRFAAMKTLDVWYARADAEELRGLLSTQGDTKRAKRVDRTIAKGARRDSSRALAKLAVAGDGEGSPRIRAEPPLIVPVGDLLDRAGVRRAERAARALLDSYLASLPGDRRHLLRRFHYADLARKVVGIGSVGTRCWVLLLTGRDGEDPLFLQAKEAPRSSLEPFTAKSAFANQGQRVVEGQRLMQAASDIFLGWLREPPGVDGLELRDFYVRQLWDAKTTVHVESLRPSDLELYARLCGWTLARAHARSGDSPAIAGYLGSSDAFDRAIAAFAESYAEQNERDYGALLEAIRAGRVIAASES